MPLVGAATRGDLHCAEPPLIALAHRASFLSVALSGSAAVAYVLAVPTEKANVTTTKIVFTLPAGFSIDSFVPASGWKRELKQTGSGDSAVIQQVTWKVASVEPGGGTPTGEDSTFSFLGQPQSSKTYTFGVEQTYSDGSIVNWSGSESSDSPAPTIEAKSSLEKGFARTLSFHCISLSVPGSASSRRGGLQALARKSGRQLT